MENKKAIKILKLIREDFDGDGNVLADGRNAIDLAIKALENQNEHDKKCDNCRYKPERYNIADFYGD